MAICVAPDVDGFIRETVDTIESCTALVLMDSAQYNILAEPMLTPDDILFVFTWGFAGVVTSYFFGYYIGVAKRGINKC